jgi:hypothetical protein
MVDFVSPQVLRLRPLEVAAGLTLLVVLFSSKIRGKPLTYKRVLDAKYDWALPALCLAYFALAAIQKFSQLWTLSLNAQDFWLFEDMTRQLQLGGPFLTRFAPQSAGWVQHGTVHPTFIWYLTVPLAWLFGPTAAALLFGPTFLAGAGYCLGVLARPRWGKAGALTLTSAFLLSTQVGRIQTYDVHPESAYPFWVLFWGWAISRRSTALLCLAVVGGMSIKEDAVFVFVPLTLAGLHIGYREGWARRALPSAITLCAALGLQLYSIHQWKSGAWGPVSWLGAAVFRQQSASFLQQNSFDSFSSIFKIGVQTVQSQGGPVGAAISLLKFLTARPFLSLMALSPWAALQVSFWLLAFPTALILAWLGGLKAALMLYYSAPLVGIFWLVVATRVRANARRALLILALSLCVGSGGLELPLSNASIDRYRAEATALTTCLGSGTETGFVPPPFLGIVPRNRVQSDRIVDEGTLPTLPAFMLLAPGLPRHETPAPGLTAKFREVIENSGWSRVTQEAGTCFEPKDRNQPSAVYLFVRKQR